MDSTFSRIDSLSIQLPRQAEAVDTHMAVRRDEERSENGRKRSFTHDDETARDPLDEAVVSVSALHIFLENFLAGLDHPDQPARPSSAPSPPAPQDSPAARAAQAYQSTARAATPAAPAAGAGNPDPHSLPALSAQEIRVIHQLLRDLQVLTDRGVSQLTIQRGESFLASLTEAVRLAMPE